MRLIFTVLVFCFVTNARAETEEWVYLQNDKIRLGVNRSAGASIGWFSERGFDVNLLNHFDHGRYLQQSWYGNPDGSKWVDKPWRWNPVQGGGYQGDAAKVLEFRSGENSIFCKSTGKHWAKGVDLPEVIFTEQIELQEWVAKIHFTMTYSGTETHVKHDQELPALFVNPSFPNMAFITPGKNEPETIQPGWPNERHKIFNEWVAYLDDQNRGIGILVPGIDTVTAYRFPGDPNNRDKGACSYVAPVKQMAVTPGFQYEYDVYLTVGTLPEIRHRFAEIRKGIKTPSANLP